MRIPTFFTFPFGDAHDAPSLPFWAGWALVSMSKKFAPRRFFKSHGAGGVPIGCWSSWCGFGIKPDLLLVEGKLGTTPNLHNPNLKLKWGAELP